MFRLDNLLERWAAVYQPLSHPLQASAPVKDRAFFRIADLELQSEWSRNMNLIDHPCLLFPMKTDCKLNAKNMNRIDQFWGLYFAVKQQGKATNTIDIDTAVDCSDRLNAMVAALVAFLTDLQAYCRNRSWPRQDTPQAIRDLGESLSREERQQVIGLRLEQTTWWSLPMHLNGWWLMGVELYGLDPRPLCILPADYGE